MTKWFLAMHLMTQAKNNVSALELMRHIGVSYPTAWLLKHKLMHVMVQREQSRQLTGRIEIDDSYLGGEVHGDKAGRGSPNKVSFVAAVQTTGSGQPMLICLSPRPFTKDSIQAFAARSLAAPATLVSAGLGCFTAFRGSGTYHAFGFRKYAAQYLGQIQYLFNRRFDLRRILLRLARAACLTSAHPLHVIRTADPSC